ncbi:hypothetical protein Tco_0287326 [Tanacetum coccineum]
MCRSDTRPPMLDRIDFASWQQRIRLYCRGKENGVNILKSIDEGPFQIGTFRETLAEGNEGALHLGPERARVYSDLSLEDKDRYNADIRATNILLQGLPKDIYTLINHYTDAKDIWDNVKMLLEGSELTKEDHESQLYYNFEHFRQNKGETIYDYYVQFAKLINDMRNIKMTMSRMQLNSKFGRQNRGQGNNALGAGAAGYEGSQNKVENANSGQARQIKVALDEEQLLFLAGGQDNVVDEDVNEQPVQDLALTVDNVFQTDDCDAFDSDVDEAPTTQTMFMANISSTYPVYDEASPSYDSDILSEVPDHDNYQDAVCEHHDVHEMHDDHVKDNAVPVVQSNVSSVPNDAYMMILNEMHEQATQCVSANEHNKVVNASLTVELARYKFSDMHDAFTAAHKRISELEAENSNLTHKIQNDDHDEMIKHFSKHENSFKARAIQIRELKENISRLQKKHSEADPIIDFKALDSQSKDLNAKVNALQDLNERLRAENEKIKEKTKCVTMLDPVKPKVLASGMYAIDVEPIPSRNRNNREVHLDYLKHLKESVKTLREIVEKAKAKKPLDSSLAYACLYTKHSQELLEYFVNKPPVNKVWRVKQVKQVSQATGKLFTNVGYQWKPNGRKFTLGEQCPLTRIPIEIGDPTYQTLHIRQLSNAGRTDRPLVFGLRLLKTYDGESTHVSYVPDEPKDNSEKQARNVQTSLTLSSAKLETQSMVDVPIHQEDPAVQRTLLIDTVTSMVTDKTTSTPTPPTTQAQVQMCSTSCWKDSQENLESFVGGRLRDVDYRLIQRTE